MADIKYNKKTGQSTLFLDGSLTVDNSGNTKSSLKEALIVSGDVVLNHNKAQEFDFSYLQLLSSAYKTFKTIDKKFLLAEGSPEEFKNLVKNSGFANTIDFFQQFDAKMEEK
jgi:anti-anti-sigma regulatory factor